MKLIDSIEQRLKNIEPIKQRMVEGKIKRIELANEMKISRQQLNNILSGYTGISLKMEKEIEECLSRLEMFV
jgi:transcriptional regulator with XRE-family HTH domain